ncbi:MAG: DUF1820 family protein [Pseudomonadota bacterium]
MLRGMLRAMSERVTYKILFQSQGKLYEIFANEVSHGAMLGFVEVAELDFGRRTEIVVDPTEDRIRSEFEGVKRTWLPMHSIVRIDEVDKRGISKITDAKGSNVAQLPVTYLPPGGGEPPKG